MAGSAADGGYTARQEDRARECPQYTLDDEDELVSDEETTCLNCRYRRWLQEGFMCMKTQPLC